VGLKAGPLVTITIEGGGGLLVKAGVAKAQLKAETQKKDEETEKNNR
jgi:hypothetical protein